MGFKDWPSWLICGLIGGLAGLFAGAVIGVLIMIRFVFDLGFLDFLRVFGFLLYLPVFLVRDVLNCTQVSCISLVLIISVVIVPLECFLPGVLIGWIISLIRKR